MNSAEQFVIYEYLDQKGDPSQLICDGHVDSMTFRDKCFKDFYVKPMVVRHQWQKTRRIVEQRPGKKYRNTRTETVYITNEEFGATPVTIGLV